MKSLTSITTDNGVMIWEGQKQFFVASEVNYL